VEREGLSASDRIVRPCSRGLHPVRALRRPSRPSSLPVLCRSRGLQPVLHVRESKGSRVPRRLAGLALAAKHSSRAVEVMKVCQVGEPAVLRPATRESPPAVEVPAAALHAAANLAGKR
jgi:hypothetical protein